MSIISRSSGLLKLVSISQLALRVFALVFFCQIESLPANAQDYLLQTGVPPFTVESPVEFGFVNLANGNLHLEIPLDSFPQRGGHPLSAAFFYDSRFWQAVNNTMQPVNYTGYQHELVQWRFVTSADPGKRGGYSSKTYSCGGTFGGTRTNYYNFRWIFPDGSTKSFPGTSTWYVDPNCAKDGYKATPTSRAQAGDASGYLMVVNSYYSPTVYGPDGTQVGTDTCCSIQNPIDTNGNYVSDASFSDPTKVDTLDRKPFVVTNSCNGNSNQICHDILNSQGTTYRVTVTTESISVSTNFQNPATDYSGTITVIQSIALPNGTSYNFAYDSGTTPGRYGELTGITLPTGGQITYGYSVFTDSLYQSQYRKNEWVTSRTSGSGTWNYTPLVVSACTTITSTNCQQQTTVAQPSGDNIVYQFTLTGSSSGGVGLTQVQAYAGAVSPANLTKTVSGTWNTAYTQKLSETVTVPVPGGSSISQTKQYAYDNNNDQNVSQLSEWKFYTGSLPATADRITSTTYTQANSSYATKNILNKPTSVVVKTGGGTQLVQTMSVYDSMELIALQAHSTSI